MSEQGTMPMTGTTGAGTGSSTTETAKAEARSVAETARDEAREVGREAQQGAVRLVDEAKDRFRTHGDEYAGRLSETLHSFSRELREMSEAGREEESTDQRIKLSEWTQQGAEQLDRFASRLDSGGVDGLLHEVRSFARRHTGSFLFGALAAGFATGRVVRNAGGGNSGRDWGDDRRYRDDMYSADWGEYQGYGGRMGGYGSTGRYQDAPFGGPGGMTGGTAAPRSGAGYVGSPEGDFRATSFEERER